VANGRFERPGCGDGYIWGLGMGFFEYIIQPREESKQVGAIVVRVNMKPVEPWDSHGRVRDTRVTLFINGINCGSRLVPLPAPD